MPSATIIESRDRNAPAKPLRKIIPGEPPKPSRVFVRWLVAHGLAHFKRTSAQAAAATRWPKDRLVAAVLRAPSEPPANLQDPDTLRALGQTMVVDYLDALAGLSSAARVLTAGLVLKFDHAAAISVPGFPPRIPVPPAPVEGGPIAVIEADASAALLEPRKIPVIVTATREMLESSNAEKMLGDALAVAVNAALESMLFDDQPASAARPAGLRSFNPAVIQSTAIDNGEAMLIDMGRLASATQHVAAGRPLIYVAAAARRLHMTLRSMGIPAAAYEILPTAMMADNLLLAIAPFALVSAVGAPTIEVAREATLHMDDAPGAVIARPTRSLFQTDTVALKITLPIAWGLRERGAAQWLRPQWPSDGGGPGGMPDGPHDGTTYGRRDGAWEQVAEEAPATPPATAFVRTNVSTSPWVPLDNLLVSYAPLASPGFIGAPTAPTPPPGDASGRLATTQFVADNAGAGGVEEVPAPNGAYARVRTGAAATDWMTLHDLGVAPLESPIFTGIPRSTTTPPVGTNSNVLATCDFVARDFLNLAGGQMIGTLIAAAGSTSTNLGVAIGDNSTGFYRPSANVLIASVGGVATAQFMPVTVAFFVPINMGNQVIQAVGDPALATDALNLRTGDSRYVRGGGQIVSPPGSNAPNDVGLGVGEATTGFYREGGDLILSQQGFPLAMFYGSRQIAINGPLSMAGSIISSVGDPAAGAAGDMDALNRRSGDARYLQLAAGGIVSGPLQVLTPPVVPNDAVNKDYVDRFRAAPVVFDLPANVDVVGNDAWFSVGVVRIILPRAGNSRIAVAVTCNIADLNGIAYADVRLSATQVNTGARISRVWLYGATPGSACGFTTVLYAQVAGGTVDVPVQIKSLAPTGAPPGFTIIGGGATVDLCSQIAITDLGPA